MRFIRRISVFMMCLMFLVMASASWGNDIIQVGTWTDLKNALKIENNGKTIQLSQNITAEATSEPLEIPSGAKISLDLNGYTLNRNLTVSQDNGHVIKVSEMATIMNGTITGGNTKGDGGGIWIGAESGKTPQILNCVIEGNKANKGGGVYIGASNSRATLINCVIRNNTAYTNGGGIATTEGGSSGCSSLYMIGCTVAGNEAEDGDPNKSTGGLYLGTYGTGEDYKLINCTFAGNKGVKYGGLYVDILLPVNIIHCAFVNNKATGTDESRSSELYVHEYNSGNQFLVTNSLLWNENTNQIATGKISFDSCAFPAGMSANDATSTDSIYIPSWDNPISSDFPSHDVKHKIFTIEDNFTALSGLVGHGKFFSAESRDIRGNLFRNPPSIGPVEYYSGTAPDISILITSRDNLAGWLGHDFIASVDIQPSGLAGKGSWDIPKLPSGLSSHDTGNTIVISGEPTQAGSFPAKITFRNGDYTTSKDITITIKPVIISPDSVAVTDKVVLMSTDYTVKFSASPDITAGYSWDVSPLKSNDIAASIDKTGNFTLKGTNAKTGSFTFHITAKRNNLICGSADVILTVRDAHMSSLSADITTGNFTCNVGTATNLAANVRAIYENGTSSDIDAGNYGLTWSADINSSLFTFTGGALTAKESAAGHSYDIPFTVTATHKTSASITGSANKTVRVTVNDIAPTFATQAQSAVKGVNFSCDITASTGTNLKWSYTGNLPAGVTISSADKKFTVSGTPARGASGSYTINITATNTAGTQTATLTLTVKGGNITVERGNPSTTTTGGKTITSNATTFKNQGGQGISSADISITADTSDWHGFTGYSFRRVISVDVSIKSQDRNYPSWSADVMFEGMPTGFTHLGSTSYSGNDSSHKFVITVSGEPVNEIDTALKVIARVRFPGGTYDSPLNTSCDKEIHIDIDNPSPVSLDVNISGSKDITVKHGDTGTLTLAHSVRAYFNDGTNSALSTGDYSTSWTTTATYTGITFSGGVLSVGGDAAIGSYNIPATLTATYNGATGSDDVILKVTVTRPDLTGITVALSTDTAHTMKRGSSLNLEASVTETYSDNTTALSTDKYAITWSADNLPAGFTLEGSTLKAGMEAAIQTHNIAVNITATGAITKTESAMLAITVNPGEISSNKGDDIGEESSSRRVTTFSENPGESGTGFNSVIFLSADITITTESDDFSGIEGVYFESPVSVDVRISQDTKYHTFTSYTLSLDVDGLSWLGVSGDNVMKNIPVTSSDFVFTLAGYPNESTNNAPVKITATVILSGDMELQASCDKQINVDIIPNAVTSLDVEIVSAGKTLTVIHGHSGTRKMSADVRAYYADGSSRDLGVNEFVPAWRLGGNYEGITISGGVLTVSNDAPVGSWDIPVIVSVDFGGKNATAQGTIHVTVTASPLASLNVEIISASKNITVQHGSSATLTLTPSVKAIYEDGTSIDLTAGEYASSWSISGSYTGITIAEGVITVSRDAAIGEYDLPVILSADFGGKNGTAQGTIHITVTDAVLVSLDVAITTARNITLKRGSSITLEGTITERYSDGTTANGAGKYSLTWTAEGLTEGVLLNGAKLTAGTNAKSGAHSFTLTATASNESITGHDTDNFTLNVNSSGKVSQYTLDPVESDDEDGSHTEIITIFDEDPDDDEGGFDSAHFASADVIISTASYDLAGVQGMAFSENVSVEVAISFDADYYTFTAYDLSLDIDGPDWLKISGDNIIRNIPIQSRDFVFVMAGTPIDSGDFPATITAHVILLGDWELEASCDKTVNINIADNAMISLDVEISGDNNLTVIYGSEASADLSAIVTASFMNGQISRLTGGYVLTWSADNLPSGITLNNGVITIGATANPGAYSLDITATATANSLTASDTFTVNATILNAITSLSVKISGDKALNVIKGSEATTTLTATVTAQNSDGTSTILTSGYNLVWSADNLPQGINFNDGAITITTAANPGTYSLDITATATATANSLTASDTFTVNATILNAITSLSVKISGDKSLTVIKGNEATTTLTATVTAQNSDGTNTTLTSGYNLAWTHGTLPDGITFNDGTITITASANPGTYSLDITATATANNLTASDTFTVNATILNAITSLSVKISGDNALTVIKGSEATTTLTATITAQNSDGTSTILTSGYNLVWTADNLPQGITFNDGTIAITSTANAGAYSIDITATATTAGFTANDSFTFRANVLKAGLSSISIDISGNNSASFPYSTGGTLTFTATATAIYADNTTEHPAPTWTYSGDLPEGFTFTQNDGVASLTASPKISADTYAVTLTATAQTLTGQTVSRSVIARITINDPTISSLRIEPTKTEFTIKRGSSAQIQANVYALYEDGSEEALSDGYNLTWAGGNDIITLSESGLITATMKAANGNHSLTANATATYAGITGNSQNAITVTVESSGKIKSEVRPIPSTPDKPAEIITIFTEDPYDDDSDLDAVILASADIIIQTSSDVYAVYVGENVNIPASVDVAISFDESLCKLTGYTLSLNANGASWLNVSRNTITAEISDSPQNSVFTLSGVPSMAGEYPVRLIASVNVSGDIPLTASANKIIRLNVTKESRSWITGRIITNSITLAPGESSAIIAEITRHDSNGAKNILGAGEYSAVWSGAGLADFMTLTQSGLLRVSESAQAGTYDITANAQVSWNGGGLSIFRKITVTIQTSGSGGGGTISPVNLSDDTEQTSQRVHEEPIQPGAAQGLLRITSGRPGYGEIDKYYTHKFTADAGGLEGALTWRITAGRLPSGIELNTSSGKISGKSQEAGDFPFTISVSAGGIGETEQSVTLKIREVKISNPSSPSSMWKCTLTPSVEKARKDTFMVKYYDMKATNVKFHNVSYTGYNKHLTKTSANAGMSALTFKGRKAIDNKLYKAKFDALNNANRIHITTESLFANGYFGYALRASDFADEVDAGITVVIGDMASSDALSIETLPLTAEQMQEVTRIEFVSSDITSISGIFATFPNLSELSFTNCPNITALNVGNSRLVWLDVAECEKLSEIIASGCNALIVLDVSECESLKAVNVSGCSTLDTLTLNGTGIEALDASGCVELVNMDISESENLASLNLTGCIALEILNISHTQINALDVSGMAGLRELYADGTMITAIDASTCPAITDLSFANAESFAALNVEGCENLARLDVSGTAIREVNVRNYNRLVYLDAGGCLQMSNIDVTGCASLDAINVAGSLIEELDLTGCPNITLIRADGCENMTLLKAEECMNLRDVYMKGILVGNLDFTGRESLRHLDVSSCSFLNELCLTKCYSLQTLNCTGCDLHSLDLKDCYSLIALYCGGNSIASLDLNGMNSLTGITCSGNGLAKLNLDGLISLDAASCGEQLVTGQIMMAQMNMKALVLNDIDRIISLRGYNSWDVEISADYDRESGMATFAETPLVVAYEYDTGFSTESGDVIMNVTVTGDTNPSNLGAYRGNGCNSGVGMIGAIAVMIFLAPKKKR